MQTSTQIRAICGNFNEDNYPHQKLPCFNIQIPFVKLTFIIN
ncbi:hypothetical protein [Chryseobacterium sp. YIM B08800]|nr:hypothetical protein [Chryseobacterium sp. YIM B08800]